MFLKYARLFGLILIIGFASGSVLLSLLAKDYQAPPESFEKRIMSYPSFFEERFYDFRMKLHMDPQNPKFDKRLVLANIDDESIASLGRFPWSRDVWSKVIRKLNQFKVKVIAFDVFFSEPERSCNIESPDIDLAKSIQEFQSTPGNKVILPYTLNDSPDSSLKEIPDNLYEFIMDSKEVQGLHTKKKFVASSVIPIPKLLEAEPLLGHIQAVEDSDGIFRHYMLVGYIDEMYFPSYSLQAYEYFTGDKPLFEFRNTESAELKIKTGTAPINLNGESKIRWLGGRNSFNSVSIKEILESSDNDERLMNILQDTIVFVGSTSFGAHDLRHTPVDPMLPGVYFHMNMVSNLLDGKFFVSEDKSALASWLMLFSGTLIIILVSLFGHAFVDLITVFLVISGLFIIDTFYLLPLGYNIKLFFCLLSCLLSYSWLTLIQFYSASNEKKKIKGTFSSFVAPTVVDEMLKNPDKVRVGGEKKEITIFFSDVRDFTSISEKLTAEELSICLNQYMGVMTNLLLDNEGTLDKYIGDAIVAFWNAPLDVEDHAYKAITTSIEMIEALPAINEEFKKQGFPLFKHGIGLNTGECSVGNMGSDRIFNYTALGDAMNLGARLESLCKFYGTELHISEFTKNAVSPENQAKLTFRILDKLRVKGKKEALTTYEVLHSTHPFKVDAQALVDYEKAFECYQTRRFKKAVELLAPLVEKYPEDKSSRRVMEICQDFLEVPPAPDWDGVFTHTSKG